MKKQIKRVCFIIYAAISIGVISIMSFNIHASGQKEMGMVLRVGFDDEGYFIQGPQKEHPNPAMDTNIYSR